jgi:signal transduction histidine kinase
MTAYPAMFAASSRTLTAVAITRPFFTYFLNRANAKAFDTRKLEWNPPGACTIEFFGTRQVSASRENAPLRACFAYVPNDPSGRYLYLSLKYTVRDVARHEQGSGFSRSDHIALDLRNRRRSAHIQLVFEPPTLAVERYPSQLRRFTGLHEVTGYIGDDSRRPTRLISGQAFEHVDEGWSEADVRKEITILVRIDSGLILDPQDADANTGAPLTKVDAAIRVYTKFPSEKKATVISDIPFDRPGTAMVSFEKLYSSYVPSKAHLVLTTAQSNSQRVLWQSDESFNEQRTASRFQTASDRWTRLILSRWYKNDVVRIEQEIVRDTGLNAVLTQDGSLLPDVATRSFFYLSIALVLVLVGSLFWWRALRNLQRIARTAYLITVEPTSDIQPIKYDRDTGEIGRLGRVIFLLISRARSRTVRANKRLRRERNEQLERSRTEQEHVRNRKAILDAIGHEIKSPLQALLTKLPNGAEGLRDVERMKRAVVALDLATSVEAGLQRSIMLNKYQDIAKYVSTLGRNLASEGIGYKGPDRGVVAYFDPIALDTVFDHVLSNAYRYRSKNSPIQIALYQETSAVHIEIYNEGSTIPEGMEETIFSLGVSSKADNVNLGQGLFVARAQMVGMNGSITAANRGNGVVFILYLTLQPE